jgi:hypothetical protein
LRHLTLPVPDTVVGMRIFECMIAGSGELSAWPFTALRRSLHCSADPRTFATYAVTNLGCIHIAQRPRGLAVSLRPRVVSPRAIVAAIYLLTDLPRQRVVLSCLVGRWQHQLFRAPTEAVHELVARLQVAEVDRVRFLRVERRLNDALNERHFGDLLRAWADDGAAFDRARLHSVAHRMLRGRYVLLRPQSDGRTLIISDFGSSYESFASDWVAHARGLRFEDQPDFRYAHAAVSAYHKVLRSRRPLLDDVDAFMSTDAGPKRLQYRRLILPLRSAGHEFLLSTSLVERSIDLRSVQ